MSKIKSEQLQENKIYELEITDLSHQGLGVAHVSNYPLFINNALPGETVRAKINHLGRRIGYGDMVEIIEKSPDRVDIIDDKHTQNGTMPLQHLAYPKQLEFKQQQVKKLLSKVGGLENIPVLPTIGMEHPYGYRNKAQIPVREIKGQLTTGFYKKGTHDLIAIEDFIIQDPKIDQVIIKVRDILRKYQIDAYNETAHTGDIRHIIVRRGHYTGEIMVVLVTRSMILPHLQDIIADIKDSIPEVVSIIQNINSEKTNVILGKKAMVLYGQDYYVDEMMGHTFNISHQSFYQVNSIQTEKLYQTAIDYADLQGTEIVVDAYCGIGTMTLALAENAKKVYGVEIVPEAISDAKDNAVANEIDNVEFTIGDAGNWLVEQVQAGLAVDVVVVDPPRKGLTPEFINSVLEIQPEKMVYVSCNPNTLARDLKLLHVGGYDVKQVKPVDMFSQTHHIENVVLLEKAK